MKKYIYLAMLLVIPMIISANHGRDRLNGVWTSVYYGTDVKVKFYDDYLKIKGNNGRGYRKFHAIGFGEFGDKYGNRIKLVSIHEMVYYDVHNRRKLVYIKEGHRLHGHVCNHDCQIRSDFFDNKYRDSRGDHYQNQGNWRDDDWDRFDDDRGGHYQEQWDNQHADTYYVRELDEYVHIRYRDNLLFAKRDNGEWVEYIQNTYRKNEFKDAKGNIYLLGDGDRLKWKSSKGSVTLNLEKRK